MERLFRLISRIEDAVVLISYVALISFVGLETVRRIITGQQAIWGPELALYAFIWMSWFAMAAHVRDGTNLSFEAIRDRLSARWRARLEIGDLLLWLIIGLIIIIQSVGLVQNNVSMNQMVFGTSIPLAAATIAVPVAWGFTMIGVLHRLVGLLRGKAPMRESSTKPADNLAL